MNFNRTNCFIIMLFIATSAVAEINPQSDLSDSYFKAWKQSQSASASEQDLEHYLSFLTEDVAWQHLPYTVSDERKEGGKDKIRQGMIQWLGNHESYQAQIIKLHKSKHYIILEFESKATIKDEETGEIKSLNRHYLDILELDEGLVAVIRRYDIKD